MKVIVSFMPELLFENKFEVLAAPPQVIYLFYSILKEAGYEADAVDPYEFYKYENAENLYEKCFAHLDKKISDDDIICFSCNSFNWGFTRIIANKISEKHPGIRMILGGLHPSIFDKYCLEVTDATLVIRTEGEKKILEVIEALENKTSLSAIKGITYRDNGEIIRNEEEDNLTLEELESSALPDYSVLPKRAKYVNIPVETSRGCLFSCAFCSIPHRHNWRGISVEEVERRVKNAMEYKDRFSPIASILFVDDCFTANAKRAKEVSKKMLEWDLNKKYFIEVRATDVCNSDLFDHFNNGLISSMQVGVECGYDDGLKKIRKGLTVAKLYEALQILYDRGFNDRMFLSFIIGFPWEGMDEINQTLDTIEYITNKFGILCNVNWLYFLPSDLWKEKEQYNIHVDESLFDDPLWVNSEKVFKSTHPMLTDEIMKNAERRLSTMKEKGLKVNFNSLPFRSTLDLVVKK